MALSDALISRQGQLFKKSCHNVHNHEGSVSAQLLDLPLQCFLSQVSYGIYLLNDYKDLAE